MLYLVASEGIVSAILAQKEGSNHLPMYYMSKIMFGPETRYSLIEKLGLALKVGSLKVAALFLKPYSRSID